ncbi:MAG: hypothetical protein JWN65_3581 [Solirubrobacterales bacterium]|jgi:SAM-dependent methyltransferase|nr:hypothetical protein [Solirubrobacterales bacterium]
MTLKSGLKAVTPDWVFRTRERYRANRAGRRFASMSTPDIFESIYQEGLWGAHPDGDLSSGRGSHDEVIVVPYVAAVRDFLTSLGPVDVVDLGCGDFNVGSQVRDACGAYVACDVAASVIARNREKFADLDVDFRVLNMLEDPLPEGDVVFIRQVLQHLSNDQIAQVLPRLGQYRWAVITEHLPSDGQFVPNLDIIPGPGIRTQVRSGVVLDEPPFELTYAAARELCVVEHNEGTITTTAYEFTGR